MYMCIYIYMYIFSDMYACMRVYTYTFRQTDNEELPTFCDYPCFVPGPSFRLQNLTMICGRILGPLTASCCLD